MISFTFDDYDFQFYYLNTIFQLSSMSLMWILCILNHNGSMVDFGWPFGFTSMAIYYLMNGIGEWKHRALICIMYIIAGSRFMIGWTFSRKHFIKEDHRWNHWRDYWKSGNGFFNNTIKSESFNFFCFYHCQSLTNLLFMSIPLHVASYNTNKDYGWPQYCGLLLWIFGFAFENLADVQLAEFKIQNKRASQENQVKVMKKGLWRYSRHPNYFGEFLIWISYSIMTLPYVTKIWELIGLLFLPFVAYYYLVYFTGAWMAEQVSVKKRGIDYVTYQKETSILFPWFPKTIKSD